MRNALLTLVLSLIVSFADHSYAEVAVIVNNTNKIDSLSSHDLLNIFMGKMELWENGSRITVYELDKNDPSTSEFYEKIVKWNLDNKNKHWAKKLFSGSGIPPFKTGSYSEMINKVSTEKGAIGFIDSGNVSGDVKRVRVTK